MKLNSRRAVLALFLVLTAFDAFAVKEGNPEPSLHILLYPDGQNCPEAVVSNGLEGPSQMINDWGDIANIGDDAWMDIYLPSECCGKMVVSCPGGGYAYSSSINEGEFVARWCLENGIAVCVVNYRMPNGNPKVPLTDIQNAFRYCRANAALWGVDKIGVIGFSAGGHLAAMASNFWTDDLTRPDFSILVYPVISLIQYPDSFTCKNLLGANPSKEDLEYYSMEKQVTERTPQTLILLSGNDPGVSPVNSLSYYRALLDCGVPGEMHIFRTGGHGWGFTANRYYPGKDRLGDTQRSEFFEIVRRWIYEL